MALSSVGRRSSRALLGLCAIALAGGLAVTLTSVKSDNRGGASSAVQPDISVLSRPATSTDALPSGSFTRFIARHGQPVEVRLAASNVGASGLNIYVATTQSGNYCLLMHSTYSDGTTSSASACDTPSALVSQHILYFITNDANNAESAVSSPELFIGLVTDNVQALNVAGENVPISQNAASASFIRGSSNQSFTLNLSDGASETHSLPSAAAS
jgi:hypothetical protein